MFEVSKLDKSKEIKEKQSLNILHILVTLEVSKLDKFNDINDEQP